jgi:hypothetical protein
MEVGEAIGSFACATLAYPRHAAVPSIGNPCQFAVVEGAAVVVVFVAVPVVVVGAVPFTAGSFVIPLPSASDRLSSMSTVWVIASVPVVSGFAAAGAIVSVAASPPTCFSRAGQAASRMETSRTAEHDATTFFI